jgi:hypothetical protein
MLNKVISGFTVIATEHVPNRGYVILAARRDGYDSWEYVVATVQNFDTDTYWDSGQYSRTLDLAFARYREVTG